MDRSEKMAMFANRLAKMAKHYGKWARRQGVSCYRVYDADMPEAPFAIDLYEEIVHIAEYERDHNMEPDEHAAWLADSLQTIGEVLDIPSDRLFLKFRQRQKGLSQYERFTRSGDEFIVRENGLRFILKPADYLDTGLFLDHRNTRQMVREQAQGKKVLNLFAYTGAFTVYAAAGGAAETLTVDLSNTYLQWADRNLALNGFTGAEHRFLQADVLEWLRERPAQRWDIIVLDPPTFSNSKRMNGTLDIQRDYVWLLNVTLKHLTYGGKLFFSTNKRNFKLQQDGVNGHILDISGQTVPNDFRNKKIHQCYEITI